MSKSSEAIFFRENGVVGRIRLISFLETAHVFKKSKYKLKMPLVIEGHLIKFHALILLRNERDVSEMGLTE